MAGKRRRDDTDNPRREGIPLIPTTLNPNWTQLKAKLSSHTRRRTHFKPEAKITQVRVSGGKNSDNPEVTADGTSSTLASFKPVNDDCSLTGAVAMDCEMVGVGSDGSRNALARVTLVNAWGNAIYDEYVRPLEAVSDFRSNISGVRAHHLKKAKDLWSVQKDVSELIKGRILVGHALQNDLKVLFLSHPKKDIRDTSAYKPLRSKAGRPRALRDLSAEILGVKIQEKEHCSVEDARAALFLYRKFKKEWEKSIREKRKKVSLQPNRAS
jgi:RNA exonuclease 4